MLPKRYFCYVWFIFSNEKNDLKEENEDEVVAAANSNKRTTSEVCFLFYFIHRAYYSLFFTKQDELRLSYRLCSSSISHNRSLITEENITYSQIPLIRTRGGGTMKVSVVSGLNFEKMRGLAFHMDDENMALCGFINEVEEVYSFTLANRTVSNL